MSEGCAARVERLDCPDGEMTRDAAPTTCSACPSRVIGLCRDIQPAQLERLSRLSSRVSVPAGHEVLRQGETCRDVLVVVAGGLMLSRVTADGRRYVDGFAWAGDVVGLAANEQSSSSAFALAPTELCRFRRSTVDALAATQPVLARNLVKRLREELALAQDLAALLGGGAAERVAGFLLRQQRSQARLGKKISRRVDLPMRRLDVAAHLSLSVETVSRIFSELARRKVIMVIPDGVRVLAQDALAEIAGEATRRSDWAPDKLPPRPCDASRAPVLMRS